MEDFLPNIIDNEQQNKQGSHHALMSALKEHPALDIRQRAEVAEEEVTALRQQHLILKNFCEKEKEKSQTLQIEIESLSRSLELKDKQISELRQQLVTVNSTTSNKASRSMVDSEKDQESLQAVKEENAMLS